MKGRYIIRLLVTVLDFLLATWIFYKFKSSGSVFDVEWKLFILSVVWVVSGIVTHKLFFDRFKRDLYAETAIIWIDILVFFAIYIITCLPFIGEPGPEIRIWGLPVIVATETVLYFILKATIIRQLPAYYEPDLSACGFDSSIDLGAKLYRSPSLTGLEVTSEGFDHLDEFHNIVKDRTWKEIVETIKGKRSYFESFSLILENNEADNKALNSPSNKDILICLERLNCTPQLNTFLAKANAALPVGGILLVHATTAKTRRDRIMESCPTLINSLIAGCDYLWSRVIPKLSLTRSFYFLVTEGRNRNLPRVEILGRLCRAGFKIVNEEQIKDEYYVYAAKVGDPVTQVKPNYGPIIKLNRIGQNGKIIGVYKMRSMYAYSEYLQAYAYSCSGLQDGGKFKNDFRITPYGHFIRKCWIDELPMVANLITGSLKLVGVRPLSAHYFSLYTPEMQALRVTVKPGLIPPFYADAHQPVTLAEVQESERRYIESYTKNPFKTDLHYLWRAFVNIVFKHKRSN